jgi:hypothetical protein
MLAVSLPLLGDCTTLECVPVEIRETGRIDASR